jgi:hypothetical protein
MKSDYERYQELQSEFDKLCRDPVGINSERFMATWRECEEIKNRHNGLPPKPPETIKPISTYARTAD